MDCFMHCPDRPLEPPDDDTADNRRYWQLVEKKEAHEMCIFHINSELEDMGFSTLPVFATRLLAQMRSIAESCPHRATRERIDDLCDQYWQY